MKAYSRFDIGKSFFIGITFTNDNALKEYRTCDDPSGLSQLRQRGPFDRLTTGLSLRRCSGQA